MSNTLIETVRRSLPMAARYAASGGSLVASSVAQLITFAILARALGPEQFALFVVLTAVTAVVLHVCGLGAVECLVRRVARDGAMYPVMLGHNLILIGASAVVVLAIGMAVVPLVFTLAPDAVDNHVAIGLILFTNIFLVRLILLAEQIFIAHSRFAEANRVVVGFALIRTATAALACLAFGATTVAEWAAWSFWCHVIMLAACVMMLRPLGAPRFALVRDEIGTGLMFMTPFLFRAFRQNLDLMILSVLVSPEVMGSYSVARRILESSFLSVDAMNRLLYPGSAVVTQAGLHHGWPRVRTAFLGAVAIGVGTAAAVYVLAPLLPILFGDEYLSLVWFTKVLCFAVIPLAIYSVALEALGASGNQTPRAMILNGSNLVGAGIVAVATFGFGIYGTVAAIYAVEIGTMVAAWAVLLMMIRASRGRAASAEAMARGAG